MGRPKQTPLTIDRPPQPDHGAALVLAGRLPPADSLSPDGRLCWSWDSVCRIFRADPEELAALLKPHSEMRRHRESGLYRLAE